MVDIVNDWQPSGIVILWTFHQQNKNYFGWHLTADRVGCISFIDLIDRMASTTDSAKRTIPLTCPWHFPFSGDGGPFIQKDYVFAEKMQLSYSATMPSETWEAQFVRGVFKLSVGSGFLSSLRAGIADINMGQGDYSIGPNDSMDKKPEDRLWFWWYIKQ
ncbi:MAG: hypothetical protein ACYDBB_17285 [Armatimonadota bacterium]